jgi:tetratricopeptide (TPR) repeat protein
VELGWQSAKMIEEMSNASAKTWTLPHLGLALAASGRYGEAARVFEEVRSFGQEHEVWPFVARSISMSAGYHLDVFDFEGNEALAEEAREWAHSLSFLPPVVSSGLDLLMNFAQRQEVDRAERLVAEVADAVAQASGWHGWAWKLRLAEARAEMALARGDFEAALTWASEAVEQGRARGRVKYHVAGLRSRAAALVALGRAQEAVSNLRQAVALARPTGDPAMFLRAATALLALDGDDALAAEARAAAERILAALPDEDMRRRFEAAEPVRLLSRLTAAPLKRWHDPAPRSRRRR